MKPGDDKKQEQQQKEAHKTRRQGNQKQEKELELEEQEEKEEKEDEEEEEEENLVERRSQEAKEVRAASRQVILLPTYMHMIYTFNIQNAHKLRIVCTWPFKRVYQVSKKRTKQDAKNLTKDQGARKPAQFISRQKVFSGQLGENYLKNRKFE